MRAVVSRHSRLSVEDWPDPVPGEGEILVRVRACGICGSDLHLLHHAERLSELSARSGAPFAMDMGRGVVFGHEMSGEIVDYGPKTERTMPIGTPVTMLPIGLGPNGVETIGYSDRFPGGYGQYVRAVRDLTVPLPSGLPHDLAALTEPMAVGFHAVQKAEMVAADVAVVIGCGPVGLSVILALKAAGHGPIIAADFSAARRAAAEACGADIVVDPATDSPYRFWSDFSVPATANERFLARVAGAPSRTGVLFECVGVPGLLQNLVEGAPPDARIIVVGVCMEPDRIEPAMAITKELDLRFVLGYTPEEFAETLHAIADGRIDVAPLITDKVGLSGVADAFERLSSPNEQVKVLIDPFKT